MVCLSGPGDTHHVLHCHWRLDFDGSVLYTERWLHGKQNSPGGKWRPMSAYFTGSHLTLCPRSTATLRVTAVRSHKLLCHISHVLSSVQQTCRSSSRWTWEEHYDLCAWLWSGPVQRRKLGYWTGYHALVCVHLIFMFDIDDKIKFWCSAGTICSSGTRSGSVLLLLQSLWRGHWRAEEYERGTGGYLWREERHRL